MHHTASKCSQQHRGAGTSFKKSAGSRVRYPTHEMTSEVESLGAAILTFWSRRQEIRELAEVAPRKRLSACQQQRASVETSLLGVRPFGDRIQRKQQLPSSPFQSLSGSSHHSPVRIYAIPTHRQLQTQLSLRRPESTAADSSPL